MARFPLLSVGPNWMRFRIVLLGICGGVYAGITIWGIGRHFGKGESHEFNHI